MADTTQLFKSAFFSKIEELEPESLQLFAAGFIQLLDAMRKGHLVPVDLDSYESGKSIQTYLDMLAEGGSEVSHD